MPTAKPKIEEQAIAPDRAKLRAAAHATIRKTHGEDAVRFLDAEADLPVEVLRTGIASLDLALGVGGLPRGRMVEAMGLNSVGKTTLACAIAAAVQRAGGAVAFIDSEHSLDPRYARRCGVDLSADGMSHLQPETGERAFDLIKTLVASGGYDLIIVDSMGGMRAKSEMEGTLDKTPRIAAQASMIAQGLYQLTPLIKQHRVVLFFTNQVRVDMGGWSPQPGVSAMKSTGGEAPKFWMGVRIELKRGASLVERGQVVGQQVKATIIKNKVAAPWRKTSYNIYYDRGIDTFGNAIEAAETLGIIQRAGSSYSFGETKLGVGKEAMQATLRERPALAAQIVEAVYAASDVSAIVAEAEYRPGEE